MKEGLLVDVTYVENLRVFLEIEASLYSYLLALFIVKQRAYLLLEEIVMLPCIGIGSAWERKDVTYLRMLDSEEVQNPTKFILGVD